jgi:uncharacterized protein (TIGR02145 family)
MVDLSASAFTQRVTVNAIEDCDYLTTYPNSNYPRGFAIVFKDEFGFEIVVPESVSVTLGVWTGSTQVLLLTIVTLPNQSKTVFNLPSSSLGNVDLSKLTINSITPINPTISYVIGDYTVCTTTINPPLGVGATPQTWMTKNLSVSNLSNGTPIQGPVTDLRTWLTLTSPAWCYYNNDPSTEETYGKLYNWYAVNTGLLAPNGWRVPTQSDYNNLITMLTSSAGGSMKETTFWHWSSPNTGANNRTRFEGLPAGQRNGTSGLYIDQTFSGYFWLNSSSGSLANFFQLNFNSSTISQGSSIYRSGFSIRVLK